MSRKFKELFISVKLEDKYSKDEILKLYLNTIYFGRDTYGIQAASREYFGKNVWELKPDQAAVLGGIIQNPNRDPGAKESKAWVTGRYQYTLKGMVSMGKLSQADADKYMQRLPKISKPGSGNQLYGGQRGYMLMRARQGGAGRQGIDSKELTTEACASTRRSTASGWRWPSTRRKTVPQVNPEKLAKKKIRVGLVSVNSANGEVVAFYGGPGYLEQEFNNVWQGKAQAGSAMKPYVLATALKQNYSLKSMVEDGRRRRSARTATWCRRTTRKPRSSRTAMTWPRDQPDHRDAGLGEHRVHPADGQGGHRRGDQDGDGRGIASDLLEPHKCCLNLALGVNSIRPIEQASGYAVFANGGVYYQPHVIRVVRYSNNKDVRLKPEVEKHRVFSPKVAADATYAMQQVIKGGTATAAALPDGRQAAEDRYHRPERLVVVRRIRPADLDRGDDLQRRGRPGREEEVGDPAGDRPGGGRHDPRPHLAVLHVARAEGPGREGVPPPAWGGIVQKWAKPPKKKKDDDRPPWCNDPIGQHDPRCQGDGDDGDRGDLPPCQSPFSNGNCDPNKPPSNPPPRWWCQIHRGIRPVATEEAAAAPRPRVSRR